MFITHECVACDSARSSIPFNPAPSFDCWPWASAGRNFLQHHDHLVRKRGERDPGKALGLQASCATCGGGSPFICGSWHILSILWAISGGVHHAGLSLSGYRSVARVLTPRVVRGKTRCDTAVDSDPRKGKRAVPIAASPTALLSAAPHLSTQAKSAAMMMAASETSSTLREKSTKTEVRSWVRYDTMLYDTHIEPSTVYDFAARCLCM